LIEFQRVDIAFRDVGQNPDRGKIGETVEDFADLIVCPSTTLRSSTTPSLGARITTLYTTIAHDLARCSRQNAHIKQSSAGANESGAVVICVRCTLLPRSLLNHETRALVEKLLAENRHQGRTTLDVRSGRDRGDVFDEAIESRRNDRNPALIDRDNARRFDCANDSAPANGDGIDPGTLNFPARP
jgi:hypothetical protein